MTVNSVPLSRTTRPVIPGRPEAAAPAIVAQHHERIGTLGRVGHLEEAARGRGRAEHGEVVLGHHLAPHHVARDGPAVPGIATLSGTPDIAGQVREGSAALPIVEIVLVAELADRGRPGVPLEQARRTVRLRAGMGRKRMAFTYPDDHAVHADTYTEVAPPPA